MIIYHDLHILNSQHYKVLTIRSRTAHNYILLEDIIYIQSKEQYSYFYMSDGTMYQSTHYLKEYEAMLTSEGFVRISKSCIINRLHLKHYDVLARKVLMRNNIELTVSVRKIKALR